MILQQATIKYKGYDPEYLKSNSHKRVCCSCDKCGRVRYVSYCRYNNLCTSCSHSGENNSQYGIRRYGKDSASYGRIVSDETKQKMSDSSPHLSGNDHPRWKGGIINRDHLKCEKNCIKLNQRFVGSAGHHIMSDVIIYIPKNIHQSVYHTLKESKQGIDEINKLAMDYLIGDL